MPDLPWTTLSDCLPDALVVLDGDACIVHVNAAAELALAWKRSELVGRPIETVVPQRLRRPEGRSFGATLLSRAAHPQAVSGTFLRQDGVEMDAEFAVAAAESPLGERLYLVSLRLLHAERAFTSFPAQREEATTDQERIYKLVFDNAPVGIIHFDSRGVITACNEPFVRVVGTTRRAVVGLNMLSLPNREIATAVAEAMAGRPAQWEGEYQSIISGKTTPARGLFAPTFDDGGKVAGGVGIIEDVTDRRNAEQALVRAERMASLGTLAAGVAHEINNPLAYAVTSVDVALRRLAFLGFPPSKEQQLVSDRLEDAREGMERVRTIVKDLGAFARVDENRREPLDMERLADAAVKLANTELRHRARLVKDYGGAPPAMGSEPRIVQVLVNLLVNAAQAIPEGAAEDQEVRIVTRQGGEDSVVVEVVDSGKGIRAEDLDRVFEPFWTDKPLGEGSGLGLSICHGIVEALGGTITVESEVGRGSCFRVTLPRAKGVEGAGEAPRAPIDTPCEAPGRPRLLIVDDEANLARTLAVGLGGVYEVVLENAGKAALELLRRGEEFDLVLCDLMIPDMPGPALFEEVSKVRPDLARRFVFMTAGAFTERSRDFLQSVDNPRIDKPFHLEALEQMLGDCLRRKR